MRWTRLDEGLLVASARRPGARSVALGIVCRAGSRHEAAHQHGLAHLFEHMVFKGTIRRSARAIAEEMEDRGGLLNAWTDREATLFHARVLPGDAARALDLLVDLVLHPRLDPADLELERQVILAEIGEADEQPGERAHDLLWQTAFPGQALGRNILGDAPSLEQLDVAACRRWLEERYQAPSLALIAVGPVEHGWLEDQAVALAAERPRRVAAEATAPARFAPGEALHAMRCEQVHDVLGWEASPAGSRAALAEQLFAVAAGGGMSSRLFQALREERGLVYDVSASLQGLADGGLFTVSLDARPRHAGQARDLALATLRSMADDLADSEIERARAQLRAQVEMALESGPGLMEWMARSVVVHGRPTRPGNLVRRLDRLTADEVRAAGRRLLGSPMVEARVGPAAALGAKRPPKRRAA